MERVRWYSRELNIREAIDKENYSEIVKYVMDNMNNIILKWDSNNYEELNDSLSLGLKLLHYFESKIKKETKLQTVFMLGKLLGMIETIEYGLKKKAVKNSMAEDIRDVYSYINHLNDVVKMLGKESTLSHSELGKELSLNDSTLSQAMKKILETGLVESRKVGKYKLYSLSDQGFLYYKQLRNVTPDSKYVNILGENNELDNMKRNGKIIDLSTYSVNTKIVAKGGSLNKYDSMKNISSFAAFASNNNEYQKEMN